MEVSKVITSPTPEQMPDKDFVSWCRRTDRLSRKRWDRLRELAGNLTGLRFKATICAVAELRIENERLSNEVHEWEETDAAAVVLGPIFCKEIDRLAKERDEALREIEELRSKGEGKNVS